MLWKELVRSGRLERLPAVVAKTTPESSAVLGPTLQAPAAIGVRGDACRYVQMRFVTLRGTHAHIENTGMCMYQYLSITMFVTLRTNLGTPLFQDISILSRENKLIFFKK